MQVSRLTFLFAFFLCLFVGCNSIGAQNITGQWDIDYRVDYTESYLTPLVIQILGQQVTGVTQYVNIDQGKIDNGKISFIVTYNNIDVEQYSFRFEGELRTNDAGQDYLSGNISGSELDVLCHCPSIDICPNGFDFKTLNPACPARPVTGTWTATRIEN